MSKVNRNNKSRIYTIPKKGSLGLLALGHTGLQLWRKKILNEKSSSRKLVGAVIGGKELSMTHIGTDEKK